MSDEPIPADRNAPPLLDICRLRVEFSTDRAPAVAVHDLSMVVPRGKIVALLGESGCGKSVTALAVAGLLPQPPATIQGEIWFSPSAGEPPVNLLALNEEQRRRLRGRRIGMIFQEPMTALHPVFRVGDQLVEALQLHHALSRNLARTRAVELLRSVGLPAPEHRVNNYPHQLSGGMRQRVLMALALAGEPSLLIADEPTTALDAAVQSLILDFLGELRERRGLSLLLITHDLDAAARIADEGYVMYAGRIVEHAAMRDLRLDPRHPYTGALWRCTPRPGRRADRLESIPGVVPDPLHPLPGCPFHPRCPLTRERAAAGDRPTRRGEGDDGVHVLRRCAESYPDEPSGVPLLRVISPGREVACWEALAS